MAAVRAAKGKLGPNDEPVNNMKARFDLIQAKARALLAEERKVPVDEVPWPHGSIHDLRRTYGTRMARVIPMHVLKGVHRAREDHHDAGVLPGRGDSGRRAGSTAMEGRQTMGRTVVLI